MPPPRRPMVRPAPDLLARPAVCGHPTGMILTRAPSRAPFALVVKITPGPQTCSRAPVGSPASTLRSDHRLALAFASGWLVHRTSHRQAAATGAALSPATTQEHRFYSTTTLQPSFGSNTRTTRFRLNLPTYLKSVDSHLHLKVMIWYNMSRQWRKPKSPAGGEVSADGEEKSSPLTLKTMCGYE